MAKKTASRSFLLDFTKPRLFIITKPEDAGNVLDASVFSNYLEEILAANWSDYSKDKLFMYVKITKPCTENRLSPSFGSLYCPTIPQDVFHRTR
jgi:hypothetical protein